MEKTQKILLVCGIMSSVLYVAIDIVAGLLFKGYSFNSQSISELSAIGASTRPLWIVMLFLYNPLLMAFGIGVWRAARRIRKHFLGLTGILLAVWGVLGFVWMFFPMHLRGAIGSTTDTMHLIMAGITVSLITLFIAFGSGARGKLFRIYSIITILLMLGFGAVVGQQAPRVAAQLPTPWLGIMERVSVHSTMLWVLVLAIVLITKKDIIANERQ